MSDLVPRLRRHRTTVMVTFDVLAWVTAYALMAWLRYDGETAEIPWPAVAPVAAAAVVTYLAAGWTLRLHQGRAPVASLAEMMLLGTAVAASGAVLFVANLFTIWVARSVPVSATFAALVVLAWGRALWRRLQERDNEMLTRQGARRVLVVGAGEGGRQLLDSMVRDPERLWRPIGILDDDPHKRHRRIRNVRVLGDTHRLAESVAQTGADSVVIAIPSASATTIERLTRAAHEADVEVKVLPSTGQMLTDTVGIRDIRDIDLTDVLGRNQLDTDIGAIADYLNGRRVLVTGAGGSIGSELCRQIDRFGPAELMMLDRDESALHAVQLTLSGRALLDTDDVILCDIRDAEAVKVLFARRRPEVVFHAAALKHLPMLEQYPAEAVKTNVLGTLNVLEAAALTGVATFVNISTDKAADPTSVLGYSKRVAERLTASFSTEVDGTYVSVRFGNVLGSRGSVLTAFAQQIAAGGPVTVTHRNVSRYFMTTEEACQLVVQAAAIGRPGEALVLDMGEPVRILDVAERLIGQSRRPIEVEFTGLRSGEKMHEELFAADEPGDVRPAHPLVSHVPVPAVTAAEVEALPTRGVPSHVARALAELSARPARQATDPVP